MGEYDAFGRKVGEDSLEDLGWEHSADASAATPTLTPAPVRATESAASAMPAATPGSAPSSAPVPASFDTDQAIRVATAAGSVGRGVGRLMRWLVIIAIVGVAIYVVKGRVEDATDFSFPGITIPSSSDGEESPTEPAPEPVKPTAPPAGLLAGSLLRQGNFDEAVRALRSRGYGRMTDLRVAADRINAQLVTKDGRIRNVQIDPGPKVRAISLSGSGFDQLAGFGYDAVDTSAPARFVRQAARRRGRPATRVDYLVLTEFGGAVSWSLFFKDGAHFVADAHGRLQRRL